MLSPLPRNGDTGLKRLEALHSLIMKTFHSHGSGRFARRDFRHLGAPVVFEPGVRVFHPQNISIGDNVYVGHSAILKGYHKNEMVVGCNSWIGPFAFLHAAGGLQVGEGVGIGPAVNILTSAHADPGRSACIMEGELCFAAVEIGDGCDIGVGAILLPGVILGRGVQVGAGAVVTRSVEDYAVVAGNPAKVLRYRPTEE
jgi:acetyltransferase-like isoleucine patch superfamily enzyme